MSDPNFRNHLIYLRHLFEVLAEKGGGRPNDVYDLVADRAGITAAQRAEQSAGNSHHPVYKNRIQFARQSLVDAGLILGPDEERWQRGYWELSEEGKILARSRLSKDKLEETIQKLAAAGARERARARGESMKLAGFEPEAAEETVPGEVTPEIDLNVPPVPASPLELRALVDTANEAAMATMLEHLRSMSDRAFEYLVGSVLKAALKAETVQITQKSRDGGFDGVLTFDSLGIRTAVFEAKRYAEGNTVGRSLLDAFATVARRRRATHSLFVTSSHFSPEAIQTARDEAIRLVDGTAFVELMAKHGFGFRPRDQFTLYEIDPAWSVDDEMPEG